MNYKNNKYKCSHNPIIGQFGDMSILVLPHSKFQRLKEDSELIYIRHILSDKNSGSVIDMLKQNQCYFL